MYAFRGTMTTATLLAGDRDFQPLIEELNRLGIYVTLKYEPRSASADLINAADARDPMYPHVLFSFARQSFQSTMPIITSAIDSHTPRDGLPIVRRGSTPKGPVEVCEGGGIARVAWPISNDPLRFQIVTFKDHASVLRMAHNEYGLTDVVWHSPDASDREKSGVLAV
jgi:hypothetical protein